MLIDAEQDDAAILKAEDEAIIAAEQQTEQQATALDALAEILSDDRTTPLHEAPEG